LGPSGHVANRDYVLAYHPLEWVLAAVDDALRKDSMGV
jgi:hypothetical protein